MTTHPDLPRREDLLAALVGVIGQEAIDCLRDEGELDDEDFLGAVMGALATAGAPDPEAVLRNLGFLE